MKYSVLRPIWVIAKTSYKEVIRDRLLYGIFLIAALLTASSFFLATISLQQDGRILENLGLAAITLFTAFICIFVTSNSLHKDMDRRALYLLLPKPINRRQYMLGKFVGMVLLLCTTVLILGGTFLIGVLVTHRELALIIPQVLAFTLMEISLLIAFTLMFAAFTAPLNASLYTLALYFIGHSLGFIRDYAARYAPAWEQRLIDVVYYLFPNLQKFDIRQAMLYNLPLSTSQVSLSIAYWLVYLVFVLWLATSILNKREV